MTWIDRLKPAAWRSPNGNRVEFQFEDVARTVEKNTAGYTFPDAEGTLVQDLGRAGRRYPLRVFFSGPDYDLQADAFEAVLLEQGVGVLEHPRYGSVDCVPFGEITQRDDLKTRANQAVIEVTFWATIGTAYPTAQTDAVQEPAAALDAFRAAQAQEFEDATRLDTQSEIVALRNTWNGWLDSVSETLEPVAQTVQTVEDEFNAINDSINRGLDVLIGEPLTLAFQTMLLIGAPARATNLISDRLDAYTDLAASIIEPITPTRGAQAANDLQAGIVFARAAVAGSVAATMSSATDARAEGGYDTQPQAIAAAEALLEQMDVVTAWSDEQVDALDGTSLTGRPVVDRGQAYAALYEAVSLAAGELVRLAFNLRKERRVVLTRPRSVIDVCAEYYGAVDEQLDFFINTNSLTGSEILELPRGKTVLIYG